MFKLHEYITLHFQHLNLLGAYYDGQITDEPVLANYKDLHTCANEMHLIFIERKKTRIQNLFKFE